MNKRIVCILACLAPLVLIFSACDFGTESKSGATGGSVVNYFPMREGSSWLYAFYDLKGNPKLDADGDAVTGYYGVSSIMESEEQEYYLMTANPQNYGGEECFEMSLLGGFTSPPPIAGLNDAVVFSGFQLLEVYEASLYSSPQMAFSEPVIKDGSTISITFTHEQPFLPYRDYELALYLNAVAGEPGGYDPFGMPIIGFTWEFKGSMDYKFRTLAELYQPPQDLYKICIADGRLYRFDEHVAQPNLSDVDSCRILLQEPLVIGNTWIAERQPYWNPNYPIITYEAEIIWCGSAVIGDTEYADAIEVDYRTDCVGYEARLWFARGVGCIKMQSDGVRAELLNYNP